MNELKGQRLYSVASINSLASVKYNKHLAFERASSGKTKSLHLNFLRRFTCGGIQLYRT